MTWHMSSPFDENPNASILPGLARVEADPALMERLRDAMSEPGFEPGTLPRVAVRMMTISRKSNAGIEDMQRLIEDDPRLVARVMRVASSVLYAAGRAKSLRTALVRLGMRSIRNLVVEATVNMVMMRPGRFASDMELLWRHCRVTAHLARLVGRYVPDIDWEEAFLCGLLHDVGLVANLAWIATFEPKTAEEVAFATARVLHEEAGGVVAKRWELPEQLEIVLSHHHRLIYEGEPHLLSAVVAVANDIAQEVSPIPDTLDHMDDHDPERAIEILGLSPEALGIVREQSEEVLTLLDG